MSTTEETLSTETETKTPTGSDAFAAARATLAAQSKDQGAGAAAEDTEAAKETETVQEPEKVADEPDETTEPEDTGLTEKELAALSPKERANAEKWQAKLTQRAQKLSATEKALEEWQPLIEGMKTNPHATLEQVAKQLGFKISKAEAKAIENHTEAAMAELPEGLEFLKPVFEKQAAQILAAAKAEVAPIKEAHAAMVQEAAAAETQSELAAFSKEFPGWEKHEAAMIQMGERILPGKGMSTSEYMGILYREVTKGIDTAERTKKTVEKINKSAAASESPTPGVNTSRVSTVKPAEFAAMSNSQRLRAAHEAAKNGIVWE